MSAIYYRHSGRMSAATLPVMLLGGLTLAVVLGFIYGLLVWWIPFIYVNFFATLGLGAGIGIGVLTLSSISHNRNLAVVVVVTVLCAVVADAAAFASWLWAVADYDNGIFHLPVMLDVLRHVVDNGVWSIGRSSQTAVSGLALVAVWVIEFGIIVGFAGYLSITDFRNSLYCEATGQWITDVEPIGPFAWISNAQAIRDQVDQEDYGWLERLRPPQEQSLQVSQTQAGAWSMLSMACSEQTYVLTLSNHTARLDKEGNEQMEVVPILRNLMIDRDSFDLIREIAMNANQAPAPAASVPADEFGDEPAGDSAADALEQLAGAQQGYEDDADSLDDRRA